MEQPDYSLLLIPAAQICLPLSLGMLIGAACMFCVTRILRRRFGRTTSLFAGQAAGLAVCAACLWTGLAPAFKAYDVRPQANAHAHPAAIGPYSSEVRCGWYAEEQARIRGARMGSGQAQTLTQALRSKAAQDDCLSTPKDYYPSRSAVEGYAFRLKDEPGCAWARNGFQLIAAERNQTTAVYQAQLHWQKAQQGGCVRY